MWDFRPLRADIERLFGRDQVGLVQLCLNSIHAWRGYARYHFSEAKRLMAEAVGDRPHHEMVGVMLGVFDKENGDFEWSRFQAAAHITACVHAIQYDGRAIPPGGSALPSSRSISGRRRYCMTLETCSMQSLPPEHKLPALHGETAQRWKRDQDTCWI